MTKILNQLRALIVDDEESIGFMTKNLLKKKGISADEANNISQAYRRLKVNKYDLYFLDLNLPDGSGFDLLSQIKKYHQAAKVVIISAHDGLEEMEKADKLGADAFIGKPFSGDDIYRVVDQLISK